MAKNSELVTVDYRSIMAIPPGLRRQMAAQGNIDPLLGVLTPGQRVSLFPNYFKENLSGLAGQRSEFGGIPTSKFPSGITSTSPRLNQTASVDASTLPSSAVPATTRFAATAGEQGPFTARERRTLDFIAKREGATDPNIIFGGERYKAALGLDKKPLTQRTVAEVFTLQDQLRQLSKADGYGKDNRGNVLGTSAVGSGQMIEGTLRANLLALGYKESDFSTLVFDKTLQEKLTLQNFKSSGIGDPNSDPSTWNKVALGNQYESLNTARGFAPMSQEEIQAIAAASPELQLDTASTASPVAGQGSVMDDTLGIGDATATPLGAADAGGIRGDDITGMYGEMRQSLPNMIDVNSPIWATLDPALSNSREQLIDADTGLVGRDALLSADAAAKVLRKNGYIPRPVSGGDNHSENHGKGKAANYSIDMAAAIETESGKIENVQAGSGLPYEIKRDMAIAAKLSAEGSGQNFRLGFPLSDSSASMHIQQDPERQSTSWGYDSRTASGADASRIILETSPEGQRYLSDIASVEKMTTEQKTELLASVTGQAPPASVAQPNVPNMNLAQIPEMPEPMNVATSSMAAGGMIAEPHTAINDRTGERTRIGEKGTGGEYIVPRNKVDASELGQQSYQMPQSAPQPSPREPTEAAIERSQPAPRVNATGQQAPSIGGTMPSHPVAPPSARKAYADAGLESRFNNFSPLGTQYRSFGA